jgi:chromosomal replication initiation ATPase DnaA
METESQRRIHTLEDIISICQRKIDEVKCSRSFVDYNPSLLLLDIAKMYDITIECIISRSRELKCVLPRKIYCLLCVLIFKLSYEKIGGIIERDRATVFITIYRSLDHYYYKDRLFKDYLDTFTESDVSKHYFAIHHSFENNMEILYNKIQNGKNRHRRLPVTGGSK